MPLAFRLAAATLLILFGVRSLEKYQYDALPEAAMLLRSHALAGKRKPRLSGAFLRWAIVGSNQWPPPCRGDLGVAAGALAGLKTARLPGGMRLPSLPSGPRETPVTSRCRDELGTSGLP